MQQAPGIKLIPGRILFFLSLFVAAFWIISRSVNVYSYAVTGAIFEFAWLPALLLTALVPVFAIICWAKEKFNMRSFYFYALVVAVMTIAVIMFIV